VVRVGLLTRSGVPVAVAAGSTVVARLLDVTALCLLALLLGPLAPGIRGGAGDGAGGATAAFGTPAVLLILIVLALGAGIAGGRRLGSGRLAPLRSRLPAPAARLARVAGDAVAGAAATPPRLLGAAAALTVASWLLEAGAVWSAARAAGVGLSPVAAAAATAVTIAFQGLQFTPGGLGLYETSLTGSLAVLGVDPAAGLSLALATHALKFAYAYLAGALCLGALALTGARRGAGGADRTGRCAPLRRALAAAARLPGRARRDVRLPPAADTPPAPPAPAASPPPLSRAA
jgi:uncharacterized membrane protein YbhN (UPF0104 family)